jgi:hypothetical protein
MKMGMYLRNGLRVAVAVVIAVLTMISPLCAPLCAATACASGNSATPSGSDDCHQSMASGAPAHGAMAAPRSCNLRESPAAAVRDARISVARHAVRISSLNVSAASNPLAEHSILLRMPASAIPKDKPPATTVLRI